MVFFVILGLMDVLVGILMLLTHFEIVHNWRLALVGAVYLIGKGIAFRGSILSWLDIAAGVYLILIMLFGLKTFLVWVFLIIMIYKFVTSLLMRG